jgi:flagellar motor switch protein FliN
MAGSEVTRRDKAEDDRSSLLEQLAEEEGDWSHESFSPLPLIDPAPGVETAGGAGEASLRDEVLRSVRLKVKVELGRARVPLRVALGLTSGSVVELSRGVDDPVDVVVNDVPIARGQVVIVDGRFCVRVTEVLTSGGGGSGS